MPTHLASSPTTAPVEFVRIPEAVRRFGISRSAIYCLIAENRIKSHCLRRIGNKTGSRLINAESLRLFIESHSA